MIRILSVSLIPVVVVLFYLAFAEHAPETPVADPDPKDWVMDDELAAYLDQFEREFEEGLNKNRIADAAVAIVKDGRVVFQKGIGVKEKGKPVANIQRK